MGQLAKQIADNSSSKFRANTENNPKEECKAVMTRGKMATMAKEEKDEKIVDGDKQQLVTKAASKDEKIVDGDKQHCFSLVLNKEQSES